MIIDQIAIQTDQAKKAKNQLEHLTAKDEWIVDEVKSEGVVRGEEVENRLRLHYNYGIGMYEFEVLEVIEGDTFQDELPDSGISHFGIHTEDAEKAREELEKEGFEYVGYMQSVDHKNTDRTYKYVFMEHESIGVFLKLIERQGDGSNYSSSKHYMRVMHKAKMIRDSKVSDYGKRRYDLEEENPEFDEMMCFSDLYRKFIRLENYYKKGNRDMNHEDVKDTLYDLLNYTAMFIQILEKQEDNVYERAFGRDSGVNL